MDTGTNVRLVAIFSLDTCSLYRHIFNWVLFVVRGKFLSLECCPQNYSLFCDLFIESFDFYSDAKLVCFVLCCKNCLVNPSLSFL